jgi:hypothetical protein
MEIVTINIFQPRIRNKPVPYRKTVTPPSLQDGPMLSPYPNTGVSGFPKSPRDSLRLSAIFNHA